MLYSDIALGSDEVLTQLDAGDDIDVAHDLFRRLILKASDGNERVAETLSNLAKTSGPVMLPMSLQTEGVPGNAVEARELLSELLLSSESPALWPSGHSWLDRSIQDESVKSLERQAIILLNGSHGREKSIPQAIALLKRASKLPGAIRSHFFLGNLAAKGIGMAQDEAAALAHFQNGAKAGSIPSLLELHRLYRDGDMVEMDLEKAASFGREAAELGDAEAAYKMGVFFETFAEKKPNWKEAAQWLQLASDRGQADASNRLAGYYRDGRLGKSDKEKALVLYRVAADQGNPEACFLLSEWYLEGNTLPKDLVASTAWLKAGARRGHLSSQNELGVRLASGLGVSRDLELAARWFARAAKREYPPAMVNLGEFLENGVGVERNLPEARRLYEAAAKANDAGAQMRLARILAAGSSTGAPDLVGAAYWAELAARNDRNFRSDADHLLNELTGTQRGELKRRLEAIDS